MTDLLHRWGDGDAEALSEIIERLYPELQRIAELHLRRERTGHTLVPTALVNEAYVRLVGQAEVSWSDRRHFLAVASRTMRRLLVEYGRARAAGKRRAIHVSLHDGDAATPGIDADAVDIAQALDRMEAAGYELESQLVQLRFFGGLSVEEAAEHLGVSRATVVRAWSFARTWLFRELHPDAAPEEG